MKTLKNDMIRYCIEVCVLNYTETCVDSYFRFEGVVSHAVYDEKQVLAFLLQEGIVNNINGLTYLTVKGKEVFGL